MESVSAVTAAYHRRFSYQQCHFLSSCRLRAIVEATCTHSAVHTTNKCRQQRTDNVGMTEIESNKARQPITSAATTATTTTMMSVVTSNASVQAQISRSTTEATRILSPRATHIIADKTCTSSLRNMDTCA
jgi:hypothetical protein